jgi:CheY-like chemotaxis protein
MIAGVPHLTASPSQRVLVVEDHIDSARSIDRLLRLFGYEVRVETDGLSAVACAESFAPAAALIDLTLPRLDGFEVAARLRECPATRDSLLVAMTGWAGEQHYQRARAAGFDKHLVKPISVDSLIDALSSAHG